MNKMIAVIGLPGTGKTTLMRKLMDTIEGEWDRVTPIPLVDCEYNNSSDLYIIGKYDEGELFAGTDRLSMAVQPKAIEFIKSKSADIIFEGDRLTTSSFLRECLEANKDLLIVNLASKKETLSKRYKDRGSDQSEKFIKGRETKIDKIISSFDFMPYIETHPNETPEDSLKVLKVILDFIGYN